MQSDSGRKVSILAGDDSVGHCEKKVHMNVCLNVSKIEMFESADLTLLDFYYCVWVKTGV